MSLTTIILAAGKSTRMLSLKSTCRVGCEKAASILKTRDWDIPLLEDLCEVMESSSICGLGQAATNPIKSSIMYFSDEIKSNE